MKKGLAALIAVILIVASVFGAVAVKNGMFSKNKFKIDEKSSIGEVVAFYNNAVKNSKDYKDFSLDVTTSVKLDGIDSSSAMLNDMLSAIIGYKVGDTRSETNSFSFVNGVMNNSDFTPLSVIQPANAYVENFKETSLLLNSVSVTDDYAQLSFEIQNEKADLDSVVAAINPIIKGETVTDKSAIIALAPNHSDFIDVGDIMSTVVNMLGISDMINSSDNDNEGKKATTSSKSIGVDGGECIIGNTEIEAYTDSDELLHSVMITVPVELKADFRLLSSIIETSIRITVTQTYALNY